MKDFFIPRENQEIKHNFILKVCKIIYNHIKTPQTHRKNIKL